MATQQATVVAETAGPSELAVRSEKVAHGFAYVPHITGALVLSAALLKAHQLATSPAIASHLPRAWWILLVQLEFVWGIWLLSGWLCRAARWASLFCFGGLAGVSLARAVSGETSCGCFGDLSLSPWLALLMDLAVLALLWRWRPRAGQRVNRVRVAAAAVGWAVIAPLAAWATLGYRPAAVAADGRIAGDGAVVLIEPRDWVGKPFPLRSYMDIGEQLAEGDWLVVIFQHDCPKCEPVLAKYKSLSEQSAGDPSGTRFAFVPLGPRADTAARSSPHIRASWLAGSLYQTRQWVARTPLVIQLREGKVLGVSRE